MSPELAILFALAVPLLGSCALLLFDRHPNLREAATLVTATILFLIVAGIYPVVAAGGRPEITLFEALPGLAFAFMVEPLGMIFALIASFLWIVTTLYSIGYMRGHHEKNQTRFYFFFAIAIFSSIGVAFAANMFTLFIFYEILTLSTFPLVTHAGTPEAKRAGRVYLGILLGTSIAFQLLAVIWTWTVAGTLDFRVGGILAGHASDLVIGILFVLYMYGIGKAALMPFHRWLPAAMVAPTPVSALLHAVAVVKAGVFTVVKVVLYIFGSETLLNIGNSQWLVYVAGFTIIMASLIALRQDNLKRRLAYSTISQLSYVVIAAAILSPQSLMGASIHIAAHAFGKITLFFCAGAIMVASHKTEVSQLKGIGKRMPFTMTAFAIGAISMIGLPPTAGFLSKWYIIQGAVAAEQMVALGVIVVSTLLNAAYFLPIVYAAFFLKEDSFEKKDSGHGHDHAHGEAPLPSVLALSITAAATIILFFFPENLLQLGHQLAEIAR